MQTKHNNKIYFFIPITLLMAALLYFVFPISTFAEDCDDIQDLDDRAECLGNKIEKKEEEYESTSKKLEDVRAKKDEVSGKISNLSSEISVTQSEITELEQDIVTTQAQLALIEDNLQRRRNSLKEKIELRNTIVRNYYQTGILNSLETFFTVNAPAGLNGFQYATATYSFERALGKNAVEVIGVLNSEINNFEKDKAEADLLKQELEGAQNQLLALKQQLDSQKLAAEGEFGELAGAQSEYEGKLKSLSEEIASLSSEQQSILAAKSGEGNSTLGDYEAPGWDVPDPPFKPAFGAFSYGAFTHYRGMSQYGAKGRAEDGQDYKDIIEFYYRNDVDEKDDFPDRLCVEGYGEMDFQDYLYGLAEMPSDWPEDALKAQAIAARTYAYRFQKQGKCICTSQSCQVFLQSKSDNPPERWKDAVDDTKDEIISGDTHAMYSSTTGGFIDDGVGWDDDGSWPGDAYEKKADSPWFYWAWYSQSFRFDSNTCGRNHPWLNEEEMADILNAVVVFEATGGSDSRISPVTTSCWGGNPYSLDGMKDKADDYGDSYDSVSSVSVDIGSNGRTQTVRFQTNRGQVSIDGATFKTVFNLRAPAYIAIRSRLFDVEMEK